MYYLLKWVKFSVRKQNIKKILENGKKILEKSGNFVSPGKVGTMFLGIKKKNSYTQNNSQTHKKTIQKELTERLLAQ